MTIKIYGSNLCPGTLHALRVLDDNNFMPVFMNVTGSINIMKEFTKLRDTLDIFADVRGTDRIGFPMFELEDGSYTRDLDAVVKLIQNERG